MSDDILTLAKQVILCRELPRRSVRLAQAVIDLHAEIDAGAAMLARQCDLAREAERERDVALNLAAKLASVERALARAQGAEADVAALVIRAERAERERDEALAELARMRDLLDAWE